MYRTLFRVVLARLDPEFAHHLAFVVIRALPFVGLGALLSRTGSRDARLRVQALGLEFDTPFGLAGGSAVWASSDSATSRSAPSPRTRSPATRNRDCSVSFPTAPSSTEWASTTAARPPRRLGSNANGAADAAR